MKYIPFTTWQIEGSTVEEYDDEKVYDTLDDALDALTHEVENSDSYTGVYVYDDNMNRIKVLCSDYDFIVSSEGYRIFDEEEARAIREREDEYFLMLNEEEHDDDSDDDDARDEDDYDYDEPLDIEVGFNPYMGDYDYDC